MEAVIVVSASLLLQVAAAVWAARLVWLTKAGRAWMLISAALLLMVGRRCVLLSYALTASGIPHVELTMEWFGLFIAALMLAGVAVSEPLLRSMRRSEELLAQHATSWKNSSPGGPRPSSGPTRNSSARSLSAAGPMPNCGTNSSSSAIC